MFLITGHVFELSFSGDFRVCDILKVQGDVENSSSASCIRLFLFIAAVQISLSAFLGGTGNTVKSSFGTVRWLQ